MLTKRSYCYLLFSFLFSSLVIGQASDSVHFTNGFKVGELTDSSAIIWTRLCASTTPVPIQHAQKAAPFKSPLNFDNDMPIKEMDGAVEGSFGQVRLEWTTADGKSRKTDWLYVSSYRDYTFKYYLDSLQSNTNYKIKIQGRRQKDAPITTVEGHFQTPPTETESIPITFTSSTCQYFWSYDDPKRGFKIYDSMRKLDPLFHCQTGDYLYYDKPGPMAYTVEQARHKWHAINSWLSLREFYQRTPLYIQKDDHDLLKDDASPFSTPFGEVTYEDGLLLWEEQTPIGKTSYRTFRWGKDLQIWLVEGREYRSRNQAPDSAEKTIWGKEQLVWFKETVDNSDATFKILMSATPVVGPDRPTGKFDNHSNASFQTEGDWLRQYLADQDMFVINGDRHWQYVSVDPNTNLMEFSQGPSSNSHAQGWDQENQQPEHRFLRVSGGFLAVKVDRESGKPTIRFLHYDVDGQVVHEEKVVRD
jgi:alkaline phosphatase D